MVVLMDLVRQYTKVVMCMKDSGNLIVLMVTVETFGQMDPIMLENM